MLATDSHVVFLRGSRTKRGHRWDRLYCRDCSDGNGGVRLGRLSNFIEEHRLAAASVMGHAALPWEIESEPPQLHKRRGLVKTVSGSELDGLVGTESEWAVKDVLLLLTDSKSKMSRGHNKGLLEQFSHGQQSKEFQPRA